MVFRPSGGFEFYILPILFISAFILGLNGVFYWIKAHNCGNTHERIILKLLLINLHYFNSHLVAKSSQNHKIENIFRGKKFHGMNLLKTLVDNEIPVEKPMRSSVPFLKYSCKIPGNARSGKYPTELAVCRAAAAISSCRSLPHSHPPKGCIIPGQWLPGAAAKAATVPFDRVNRRLLSPYRA